MKKRLYLIIYIAIWLISIPISAQEIDSRQIYDEAIEAYNIGRIDRAVDLLNEHINIFNGNLKQSALRLLSICHLNMDQPKEAETYAAKLLNEDPYYSPSAQDPQRFVDMIEQIKLGRIATITTASSQEENLNEVPVPTTLITEEMIKDSGARNLQEVLATYVPGMNIIDCNDGKFNISMRGIFSTGQGKILIMLNGHRLNSFATNEASPDFSISLEKVKQIEVLRGPASSLYGGVALTAVVNVITKQGGDVDGLELKAGAGNYGQIRGDAIFGKRYFDLDLLIWGSLYKSSGEKKFVLAEETGLGIYDGDAIIGCIGEKPTYDIGLSMNYNGLQFLYNAQFSQVVMPLTTSYLFSHYNIDKYRTFNGIWPSHATLSHHGDISYSRQIGKVWMKGTVTYDNNDQTTYQVITEEEASSILSIMPIPESIWPYIDGQPGIFSYVNGQEHTFGAKLQADWNYIRNSSHKGNLTFGAEYNHFKLEDVRYIYGYSYKKTVPENDSTSLLGKGHENSFNGFIQLKHQWQNFILNAGLRLDTKTRFDDTHIHEFSPRLALIYVNPKWNIKFSYSKAYIDAPYLYRKSNILFTHIESGKTDYALDLIPETLHSWQLTFNATNWINGLNFEVNGFVNRAKDLINILDIDYVNAGEMTSFGTELSGSYETPHFTAHLNATWQKTNDSKVIYWRVNHLVNTPEFMVNALLAWRPVKNLKLHSHLSFYDKQHTFYLDFLNYSIYMNCIELLMREGLSEEERIYYMEQGNESFNNSIKQSEIDPRVLVNIGANYTLGRLELYIDIHNLFNTKYWQSGMSTGSIPQQGLWFMAGIGYKF